MPQPHITRNAPTPRPDGLMQRLQVQTSTPGTADGKTRSIEVIGATEAPSQVWDPERWEVVTESLLMSGCEIPTDRQIPLTIEHERSARSVIGSFTEMRIDGDKLVGRAVFSSSPTQIPSGSNPRKAI